MRRELSGLSLNPSTRWAEAIKQAQYSNLTKPRRKSAEPPGSSGGDSKAVQNWKRISKITHHAHGESPTSKATSSDDGDHESLLGKIRPKRHKHSQSGQKHTWEGKMMDLPYFLEMVDQKHRYGSNLRSYHAEWKKTDSHENFFYWLDHGEGKDVEIPHCSRERLDREQVRYLSREERMQYLVKVDQQGRLCWRKNGERIDTTIEYRDSVKGIVPVDDNTKVYREDEIRELEKAAKERQRKENSDQPDNASDSESSGAISIASQGSSGSSISDESGKRYPDPPNFQKARGPRKLKTVSPHLILNRLMRTTVKKNTWIFVFDTSMNLYVGIKQSGDFQHSSFLHGSRISAAGLIKIKHGQLRSLSPLSGHYRPPAKAFRSFVHNLRDQGVDMSRVSISKAYAVLVGLEAYMTSKQRVHEAGHKVKVGIERVVSPEKAKAREESEKDPSQSARLEEEKLREIEAQKGTGLERVLREVKERVSSTYGADSGTRTVASQRRESLEANPTNAASNVATPPPNAARLDGSKEDAKGVKDEPGEPKPVRDAEPNLHILSERSISSGLNTSNADTSQPTATG